MLAMTHQIENMKQLKVIISGGGSGGHIFPAIAIASAGKICPPDPPPLIIILSCFIFSI